MKEQSKQSAGALRAARMLNLVRYPDTSRMLTEKRAAQIIDRETGLAELLDAAIKAHSYLQGVRTGSQWDEANVVERLQQAIAKVEQA